MKRVKYRLVLDVEFDPNGTEQAELEHNLRQVIRDAVNKGTLTAWTPATVEGWSGSVEKIS